MPQLHLKPATGGELGLEDYVQQILSRPHLGMLELVLFMRMLFSRCDSASEMYCQIWQAGEQQPMMLWLTPPESSQNEVESSASVVISLMLVSLPQSKQLVWLPLSAEQADQADQDHAMPSCEAVNWQGCLQALDTSLVQADARNSLVKQAQQKQPVVQTSIHSYLRRKLRRGNQTAQPAESAASVLIRGKRRQSPDNSTAGGSKVQCTQ